MKTKSFLFLSRAEQLSAFSALSDTQKYFMLKAFSDNRVMTTLYNAWVASSDLTTVSASIASIESSHADLSGTATLQDDGSLIITDGLGNIIS